MYYALLLVFPTVTCCVCQHSSKVLLTYLLIYFSFQQCKNFENLLRTDKVIAMSLVYYCFLDTVYSAVQVLTVFVDSCRTPSWQRGLWRSLSMTLIGFPSTIRSDKLLYR